MTDTPRCPRGYRFGVFELDLRNGELRREGRRVRLQEKPGRALAALLEAGGELVTREELRDRLWPPGTHVEFEAGLHAAINRLREVLRDSADAPRFIETIPRRGYRFLAPIEVVAAPPSRPSTPARSLRILVGLAVIAVTVAASWMTARFLGPDGPDEERLRLLVLPFEYLEADAPDHFTDGLTEEMITRLGGMRPDLLGVIARTTSMQYRGTDRSAARIGRELDVDYLLEGRVRRDGERIRISVQLVATADQTPIWTGAFDEPLRDILTVQDNVARRVASALAIELLADGSHVGPVEPAAWEAHARGRHFLERRTKDGFYRALEEFDRALEIDPGWAPAWVGRADSYVLLGNYDFIRPTEAFPAAEAAVQRALELDPGLAAAHTTLGMIRHAHDWDWPGAEREFRRALEANPASVRAHHWYAVHLTSMGRHEEAVRHLEEARRIDPLSSIVHSEIGWRRFYARRYDDAIAALEQTLVLDPGFVVAHDNLNWVYFVTGDIERCLAHKLRVAELEGAAPGELQALREAVDRDGWRAVRRAGIPSDDEVAAAGYISPYDLALEWTAVGEPARALPWLLRSCAEREIDLTMLDVDPRIDPLRTEPGFAEVQRCVGLPRGDR